MNKIVISAGVALALFATALPAFAQTYYPTATYSTTGCVAITPTLSQGSSGSQVTALQQFLVAQNYPGGGSWMETGYFGAATAAAVVDFQQLHGLPQTGLIDSATAAAISSTSCGGGIVNSNYSYLYPYTTPSYTSPVTYPYNYNNYYAQAPVITSLSQNTGSPGSTVIISGVGFDPTGNTISIGGTTLSGIPSPNGTTLTFTIPFTTEYSYSYGYAGTPTQLTVTDSRGTSNAVSFTIYGGSYNQYPYTCGSSYPYSAATSYAYCPPTSNTTAPTISYLSPTSGGVGTDVVVYGSGFSTAGNTVHFGPAIITNLQSPDGESVSFTVPGTLTGYGTQPITLSSYQVSVTNSYGYSSNALPFTVTALISNVAPTISGVTGPTSLAVGQQGQWSVVVNSANNSYLTVSASWGDQGTYASAAAAPQSVYGASQTLIFTHTYYTAGTYSIVFTISNGSGQQNSFTTSIAVGQTQQQGALSISYLSPSSGGVGTQVMIQGSGFSATGNTVHFGQGGSMNVPSQNGGTTIYYIVPSAVSPCDVQTSGSICQTYAQSVTPGSYPLSVTNAYGASSNSLSFQVQ